MISHKSFSNYNMRARSKLIAERSCKNFSHIRKPCITKAKNSVTSNTPLPAQDVLRSFPSVAPSGNLGCIQSLLRAVCRHRLKALQVAIVVAFAAAGSLPALAHTALKPSNWESWVHSLLRALCPHHLKAALKPSNWESCSLLRASSLHRPEALIPVWES